jgi:hypothetical protein
LVHGKADWGETEGARVVSDMFLISGKENSALGGGIKANFANNIFTVVHGIFVEPDDR